MAERELCVECGKDYKNKQALRSHERISHRIYKRSARTAANVADQAHMVIGPAPERVEVSVRNGTKVTSIICHILTLPEVVDAIAGGLRQAIAHKGIKV